MSDCRFGDGVGEGSQVRIPARPHSSDVDIDHGIISTVSHPLPRIQEGQLSVTGKYWLTAYSTKPAQEKCE